MKFLKSKLGILAFVAIFLIGALFFYFNNSKSSGDSYLNGINLTGNENLSANFEPKPQIKHSNSSKGGKIWLKLSQKSSSQIYLPSQTYIKLSSPDPQLLLQNKSVFYDGYNEESDSKSKIINKSFDKNIDSQTGMYPVYVFDYELPNNMAEFYLPFEKIAFSGCEVTTSSGVVKVFDIFPGCEVALLAKTGFVYQFGNVYKKFSGDVFFLFKLKLQPAVNRVLVRLSGYDFARLRVEPGFVSYLDLPLLAQKHTQIFIDDFKPEHFLDDQPADTPLESSKIIKQMSLFKIYRNIKDLEAFGIKKDLIPASKLIDYKGLDGVYLEQIASSSTGLLDFVPQPGEYLVLIKDVNGYEYLVGFKVKEGLDKGDYTINYSKDDVYLDVYSKYPFVKEATQQSLKRFFAPYDVKISWDSDTSFRAFYQIPPGKTISGEISLFSVGGEIKVPFWVHLKKIPAQYVYANIEGKPVNVLPLNGYRGKYLSLSVKNLKDFDLYFQKCEINLNPNDGIAQTQDLFKCNSPVLSKHYTIKDFEYWKEYYIDYPLSKDISSWTYFRVATNKDFANSKYFKKTNLGVIAKILPDSAYFFVNSFDEGKPLNDVELTLYGYRANNLQKLQNQRIKNGMIRLTYSGFDAYLAIFNKNNDQTFLWFNQDGYIYNTAKYRYVDFPHYINPYDIGENLTRSTPQTIKIYGYTDRGLYKPGDDVFFAGWVRDLEKPTHIPQGEVKVKLSSYDDEIAKYTIKQLDSFGGFKGKLQIPQDTSLGTYRVQFIFDDDISYTQNIKVEEYQKPTFLIATDFTTQYGVVYTQITPKYYFGEPLKDYDLWIDWQLQGKDICRYCWWWNDKDYYFNRVFENTINTGGNLSYNNLADATTIPLVDLKKLKNLSYKITLKIQTEVKDNLTDETHLQTDYFDIEPPVLIGLAGQPVERIWSDGVYKIKGKVDKTLPGVKYKYEIYFKPFGYEQQKGVDGEYYFINKFKFKKIKEGNLSVKNQKFTINFQPSEGGEYFVRVLAQDKDVIVGEVQKRLYYYKGDSRWFGDQKNNFALEVTIPKKEYKLGENIPININPYFDGAYVLLSIERGNKIIDLYKMQLSGGEIQIPVKKEYFPNINVSVVEIMGENQDKSATAQRPPQPKFFIGYGEAQIDQSLVKLVINIKTDKKEYKPGEKMQFTIYTTDAWGNPVNARLSVGIVDKALADLYDLIKKPIPYFYNKLGSLVANFANWKDLYHSLRVFSSKGSKGGGGGEEGALQAIRQKLYDLAFWRGGVFTSGGKITLQTQLPDNLTTWMIDVVGITKDLKLGTARAYFTTTKDLIINPNLPTFLTIGDKLKLPVGVIAKNPNAKVSLKIYQGFKQQGKIDWQLISSQKITASQKAYFDLSLPQDKFYYDEIYLKFEATAGKANDGLQVSIPIRKEGFVLNQFSFTGAKEIVHSFKFEDIASKVVYQLGVASVPIEAFNQALKYLLHYPYGCTEQLASSLYPILVAQDLHNKGINLGDIIKGQKINLGNRWSGPKWTDINDVVQSTIVKIFKNQKLDGGLGYWTDSNEKSNKVLSAYVYGVLKQASKLGYQLPANKFAKLEAYLQRLGNSDPIVYLYYLRVKTQAGEDINFALFQNVYNRLKGNLIADVLAFAIYANEGKEIQISPDWSQNAELRGDYRNFLTKPILKSIWLRALVKQGNIAQAQQIVLQLLESRGSNGVWGWSTQQNVQILLALGDYIQKIKTSPDEIICDVKVGNIAKKLKFSQFTGISLELDNISKLDTQVSCSKQVLIDQKVDYVLKDLTKIKSVLHNLKDVSWLMEGEEGIGSVAQFDGSFAVSKDVDHLAVEFYIPSTFKFLSSISKMKDGYQLPFETNCRRQISHYETRFDRLFLYFAHLDQGTSCWVKIKALKAFDGQANIMPVKIYGMYGGEVWGRRVVK